MHKTLMGTIPSPPLHTHSASSHARRSNPVPRSLFAEECIFFLKAPCLALDVFMFKTGLRIACADQFGNVELLSPVFVEAPVALEGDHTADEESLGEESEEYSDDFEEPESLEAEKVRVCPQPDS